MSKRINKKLLQEEQQEIGAIYQQYIDTFQQSSEIARKVFVKSETLYADGAQTSSEKGQLYTPMPRVKCKREEPSKQSHVHPTKNLNKGKKQSNLKSLGDELKLLQYERQANDMKLLPKMDLPPSVNLDDYSASTNLFVSNLKQHITESQLIDLFGPYGPLASVKIMWPRADSGNKSTNCGFVAFMSRTDAERALKAMKKHPEEMRISWGKSVKLPPYPVHIPPAIYKLYSPPPPSGFPFNAQMPRNETELKNAVVRVTPPFDRNLLMTIHRLIEFVIREGPEFEAMIMNLEFENRDYDFLINHQSPAHVYYRWKMYSILVGDSKNAWSMKPFRMYKDGPIWIPPTPLDYTNGMPQELIEQIDKDNLVLTEAQSSRLVHLIRNLTVSRKSISEVLIFCMNHASAIDDSLEILKDSFANPSTNPVKKIARLYLLSDILYNCKTKLNWVTKLDQAIGTLLMEIFQHLHCTYKNFKHSQDKNCFKMKVLSVLRAWVYHNLYDVQVIIQLENIFLSGNESGDDDDNSLNDEPLDGANLVKRSLQTATTDCLIVEKKSEGSFDIFNV